MSSSFMRVYDNLFNEIISPEKLFIAWDIFRRGKWHRPDVQDFERNLESNIFQLARALGERRYCHGHYTAFRICDPKLRDVHKATVRDRIVHHAVFKVLNLVYEPTFISPSFSCRLGKGTHKGVNTLEKMLRQTSQNYMQTCYALKCDIKKFFDSVDHAILLAILGRKIKDPNVMWLLETIVKSYLSTYERERERERERVKMLAKLVCPSAI